VIVVWDEADQDAANLLYVEYGALTDNAATGTNAQAIHPGPTFRAILDVRGRSVYVSGSSAFDINIDAVR
jgi:hypothetical protein